MGQRLRTSFLEFDGVDLDTDDEARIVDSAPGLFNHLEQDTAAVFERASIFISPLVCGLTDELGDQVAMSSVDLISL